MLSFLSAFSAFSVDNLEKARAFYSKTLDLPIEEVEDNKMGLHVQLPGNSTLFIYEKDTHKPATFTVLNFVVENIDKAVDDLGKKGITFEVYEGFHQDEKGIARGIAAHKGPDIAWFKDPAGNILSVMQE